MNKSPSFQMYPGDFLSDIKVILMSMDERGVYITLLCHHWIESGLPNNEKELQRLCHHPDNWPQIWEKVGHCFYEKNGKLYNKRLQKEKKKQREWRKKSQLGGIKSGETRRKMAEAKTNHPSEKDKPNTNTSSSSSSSSSLLNKNPLEEGIFFDFDKKKFSHIEEEDIQIWKDAYPKCDMELELNKMRAWLIADPKRRKKNYKRFINNWLSRTQDSGGTKGATNGMTSDEFNKLHKDALIK